MSFIDTVFAATNSLLFGALNTILAALFAIIIGTISGILLGFLLCYANRYFRFPVRLYVDIIRGVPGLVTLFSVYFFLGYFLQGYGIDLSPLVSGVVALSAMCAADVAELTRGALQSIPQGQTEAGKAIGLRFDQIFFKILLPQAAVQILPPWVNTATEMVKGSTLLSLIGVSELLLTANQLVATNGSALSYYSLIGLIFFLLNSLIQFLGARLEKRLTFSHELKETTNA